MGWKVGWQRGLRLLFVWAFSFVVIFVLARMYLRDVVLELPGFSYFEQTMFGGVIGRLIDDFSNVVFGGKPPGAATAEAVVGWINAFADDLSNIKRAQLIAAGLGAFIFAAVGIAINLWRNRKIQQMCSAQLYATAIKLHENGGVLHKAFDVKADDRGKENKITLHVDNEVRAAMHRLRSELELIQDFTVAYDYTFWPKLRESTARLRMQSMATREAIEVVMSEIDRMSDEDTYIDVTSRRFFAMVVRAGFDGIGIKYIPGAVASVIDKTVLLGEKLELGYFFQWRRAGLDTLPTTVPTVRARLEWLLTQARENIKTEEKWWSGKAATWMSASDS